MYIPRGIVPDYQTYIVDFVYMTPVARFPHGFPALYPILTGLGGILSVAVGPLL